jgi:hypothetical protein
MEEARKIVGDKYVMNGKGKTFTKDILMRISKALEEKDREIEMLKEELAGNICGYCLEHSTDDCPHNPNKPILKSGHAGENQVWIKETTTIKLLREALEKIAKWSALPNDATIIAKQALEETK